MKLILETKQLKQRREESELLDRAELTLINVLARCEKTEGTAPVNTDDFTVSVKLAIELILHAEDVMYGIATRKPLVRL